MFILIRALVYATLFIGFVLIAVPARLLSASGLTSPSLAGPVQLLGAAMAVAGALVAVACILTFVVIGRGTPAPFDPPRKLVARGPYRFVRNPMYLGAAMAMSGAAIVYRSWLLIGYVAVFLAITHAFVVGYEEPTLRRTFGAAYDDYCRRVGRWWPAFSFVLALALVIAAVLSAQWPVLAKPILVANSCGGWTQTLLAVQHPERLGGLVYLEAADDPMLTIADYNFPPVDEANQPKRVEPPALDYSSFDAYRRTQKARSGVTFPEAELRYLFSVKPDGSLGPELMSSTVRQAVTVDARRKQDYANVRVPVLAIFRTPPPFEDVARGYVIQNDLQRAALRQRTDAEKIRTAKWEKDLRAGVPTAKIVELPGASLYMFLSNEADIIRELRAFEATLPR